MLKIFLQTVLEILRLFFSPKAREQRKEDEIKNWKKKLADINEEMEQAYIKKDEYLYQQMDAKRKDILKQIQRLMPVILNITILVCLLSGCSSVQYIPYSTEGKPWLVPKGSRIIREIEPKEAIVDYDGICLPEGEHQRLERIEEDYVLDQLTK